jgi:hypothetical protein
MKINQLIIRFIICVLDIFDTMNSKNKKLFCYETA